MKRKKRDRGLYRHCRKQKLDDLHKREDEREMELLKNETPNFLKTGSGLFSDSRQEST